jgi:uncharacterized membrane protein YraQ (UPF0718 family)
MSSKGNVHQKKQQKLGEVMLIIVLLLYIIAAMFNIDATLEAIKSTGEILKIIAPILLIVIFIVAIINQFVHPKQLSKYFGKKSGKKSWLITAAIGVVSHGPGYIWYPMLRDLREHGVKDGLIVTFIYARSVKVPWLPVMAGYFGITFTVLLTLMTLIGAIVQGMIAQKLMQGVSSD